MHDLTAAHRTLPMGSRVLVTNTTTGDAAEVRINDRGPFKDDRVLDLSYGAARLLGAVDPGVIPVKLQVIALPAGSATVPAGGRYTVQLGAFASRERAEALRQELDREGVAAVVTEVGSPDDTYYRVRVGDYPDRSQAQEAARALAGRGRRAVIVER
jgi:rare lipoprotein A